jgi:hypothetical protein
MQLKGKVVRKEFAKGSKSEHEAVYIDTSSGLFLLRQTGANPFQNPELKKLIGKDVQVDGTVQDYLFMADTITVI